jgi:hypothetical protein
VAIRGRGVDVDVEIEAREVRVAPSVALLSLPFAPRFCSRQNLRR